MSIAFPSGLWFKYPQIEGDGAGTEMATMAQDADKAPCAHCGELVAVDDLNDYGHCPDCAKHECDECHAVEECDRDCQCPECEQARLEDTCIAFDDTYND